MYFGWVPVYLFVKPLLPQWFFFFKRKKIIAICVRAVCGGQSSVG